MKKGYYWFLGILFVLVITNPSVKAFKDYLGNTSYINLRRENNFFVCSKYSYYGKQYFAIVGNFFTIPKPIQNKVLNPVKKTDNDTKASNGTISSPLLNDETKLFLLPYKDRIFLALRDNVKEFNISYQEFDSKIKQKQYALNIYNIFKKNFNDFKRSREEFLDSLKINDAEEDWSKYEIKKKKK